MGMGAKIGGGAYWKIGGGAYSYIRVLPNGFVRYVNMNIRA